jgi:hypothetical protein
MRKRIPWNKGKIGIQVAWNKGKHCFEETKNKISKFQQGNKNCLGHKLSKEHKKKLSEIRKKQIPPNLGHKHSIETKKKMSESAKNRTINNILEVNK